MLKYTLLISLISCVSACGAQLSNAQVESGIDTAKDSVRRAEAIYAAVCVPPLVSDMQPVCTKLAEALAVGNTAVLDVEVAYEAVKALSPAK